MCRQVVRFTFGCGCRKNTNGWILPCKDAKCVAAVESRRKKAEPVEMRKKHVICDRHQRKWGVESPTPTMNGREHASSQGERQRPRKESRPGPPNFSMPRGAPSQAQTGARSGYDDDRYTAYTDWTSTDDYETDAEAEEEVGAAGPGTASVRGGATKTANADDKEKAKKRRGLKKVFDVFNFLDTSSDDEITGRKK